MTLDERYELAPSPRGFRCSYTFHKGALVVTVSERMLYFDEKSNGLTGAWFNHSNIGVCFGSSRETARAIVEHHVRFFDDELAATLGPIWEAWDAAPVTGADAAQRVGVPRGPMN